VRPRPDALILAKPGTVCGIWDLPLKGKRRRWRPPTRPHERAAGVHRRVCGEKHRALDFLAPPTRRLETRRSRLDLAVLAGRDLDARGRPRTRPRPHRRTIEARPIALAITTTSYGYVEVVDSQGLPKTAKPAAGPQDYEVEATHQRLARICQYGGRPDHQRTSVRGAAAVPQCTVRERIWPARRARPSGADGGHSPGRRSARPASAGRRPANHPRARVNYSVVWPEYEDCHFPTKVGRI
jgi:hypothetical protein